MSTGEYAVGARNVVEHLFVNMVKQDHTVLLVVVDQSVNMVREDHIVLLVVVDLSVNIANDEAIAEFVVDVSMERGNIAALFVVQIE